MSAALERVDPADALADAQATIDRLQAADLTVLSDEALLDYEREKERLRRRLASLDHASVLEIESRGLPDRYHARNTGQFLRGLLRLDPREANTRAKAAHATGVRRGLTGQPLPPIYPVLAEAEDAGDISERHQRVVVDTIEKLPEQVQAEHGEQIEADLVGYARQFDPHQLARLAERISAYYDPDARLKDVDYRAKHRDLSVHQHPDGSCSGTFEGTAEFTELLLLHLDAFARPKPEADGIKDPRSAGQRRHDALLEALKLNLRAQQLPTVAGVTATIVLTMSAQDYQQRTGLARTGHGALIPVPEAIRLSAGEYRLLNVVIDKTRGITAYSSSARLYPENARLALIALDKGCTFPGCNAPPGWCEIDHCLDFALGGPTSIDNAVLACRYHNNDAKKQGWQSTRINGRAAWIPPRWIDPDQKPRHNHLHDTEPSRD